MRSPCLAARAFSFQMKERIGISSLDFFRPHRVHVRFELLPPMRQRMDVKWISIPALQVAEHPFPALLGIVKAGTAQEHNELPAATRTLAAGNPYRFLFVRC